MYSKDVLFAIFYFLHVPLFFDPGVLFLHKLFRTLRISIIKKILSMYTWLWLSVTGFTTKLYMSLRSMILKYLNANAFDNYIQENYNNSGTNEFSNFNCLYIYFFGFHFSSNANLIVENLMVYNAILLLFFGYSD